MFSKRKKISKIQEAVNTKNYDLVCFFLNTTHKEPFIILIFTFSLILFPSMR